jgi:choline dehydrogenase-like flavoprotein
MTLPQGSYDAVIIGAGPVGVTIAKTLTDQGKRVLLLEAGRASGLSYDGWLSYVDTYRSALVKEPNSPYPPNANAQSTYGQDILNLHKRVPILSGYQVEKGPLAFGSTYLRSLGGTSLHWLGTCPRMVPADFRMKSEYGVGVDWPLTYDELQDYYCKAEWMLGVSANKESRSTSGSGSPTVRHRWSASRPATPDTCAPKGRRGDGALGDRSTACRYVAGAGAQLVPRAGYTPRGQVRRHMWATLRGNASCIPICPVQAKYSALRTLNEMDANFYTLVTQAVASRLLIGENGRISGVEFKRYESEGSTQYATYTATGTLYILAAHSVESAKLLLASGAANSSDQVGRNLMDHPFFLTWALNPTPVGAFRGPGQTSEIPSFRDGPFRSVLPSHRRRNWGGHCHLTNCVQMRRAERLAGRCGSSSATSPAARGVMNPEPATASPSTASSWSVGCYRDPLQHRTHARRDGIGQQDLNALFRAMGIRTTTSSPASPDSQAT